MKLKARGLWLAVVVAAACMAPAKAVPILPLDQVKEGMKGYGLTVFQGSRIERFDITVLGVLRAFDFQMDMILIRVDSGPVVTQKLGSVAGMSGSPIYVNDKLVGAYAYGFPFQNAPLAGVTPIEQMLEQFDPKHPQAKAAAARRNALAGPPAAAGTRAEGALQPVGGSVVLEGRRFSEVRVAANRSDADTMRRIRPDVGVMVPVSTPVLVSGVGGAAFRHLQRMLEPFNLTPMQAGAAQVPANPKVDFSPGAAVGVALVTGDIEMTAVGTLTYRDQDTVMAFGHPFFGLGAVELPMTTCWITTIVPSYEGSFKMGGAIAPVGSITQDRPTCVGGSVGKVPEMIPVEYRMHDIVREADRTFRFRAARQGRITPMLAAQLLEGAMGSVIGGSFEGVINSKVEVTCRNGKAGDPLSIVRQNCFDTKLSSAGLGMPLEDLFMTLSLLRVNPWGDAPVQSIKVGMDFEADRKLASIERMRASKQVVKRGETIEVTAYLKEYGGKAKPTTVSLTIPDNAPLGPTLTILAGGGVAAAVRELVNPEPYPRDVPSMVRYLNSSVRNDCIVVEMVQPTNGLEFSGRVMHDMPNPVSAALETADMESLSQRMDVVEQIIPTDGVVTGANAVLLEVVGDDGRRADRGTVDVDQIDSPRHGSFGSPGMGGMMMAAGRELDVMFGKAVPTDEVRWLATPSGDPYHVRESLSQAVKAAWSGYRPARASWPLAARPVPRAVGDSKVQPADDTEAGAADGDKPDVTGDLGLGKPPKMPGYKELADIKSGDLGADTPSDGSGGEGSDEDGEPVARPVSSWTVTTAEEFGAGQFDHTYTDSGGSVRLAPSVATLGRPDVERAWAVLPRPDGSVVVGSWGEKAKVVKLVVGAKPEVLADLDEAGVGALGALADGTLIAGTVPSGKLYRLGAEGKSTVFCELPEPYVWSLLPDGKGGLYAATGNHGRVYQIDAQGKATPVMQVGDRHIMAMVQAPDGDLVVGTFPDGKVYRLHGTTVQSVYQVKEGSVSALALNAKGHLYVGASNGAVFRILPDGSSRQLMDGSDSAVYGMVTVGDHVYAATAEPAQVLQFDGDDTLAQVYENDEPYLLGASADGKGGICLATASLGEVLRINVDGGETGKYTSEVLDCGMTAKWGQARWRQLVTGHSVIGVETRSGNTADPDAAWSAWSPMLSRPDGSAITSPSGRYLQFRARFLGKPGDTVRLDRIDLSYRTIKRAVIPTRTSPTTRSSTPRPDRPSGRRSTPRPAQATPRIAKTPRAARSSPTSRARATAQPRTSRARHPSTRRTSPVRAMPLVPWPHRRGPRPVSRARCRWRHLLRRHAVRAVVGPASWTRRASTRPMPRSRPSTRTCPKRSSNGTPVSCRTA
ncbi:MAG: hypothetical protein HZB16_14045, partial [Armatimonadetes bacterium]|nr:hypothetical protein [Armatimonadota bacterium]